MTVNTADKNRVVVFDTTLRDGEQCPGATMNTREKLEIAHQLVRLGVDVIEAGFPISSSGDFESVRTIASEVKGATICGLARAVEKDITRAGEALAPAESRRIHVFIATSQIHLEKKLRKSKEDVIKTAVESVKLARTFTPDVEFSCEDAGRSDRDYLVDIVTAVIEGGATTINLPDTVGYTMPWQFGETIGYVIKNVPNSDKAVFSVHCHNDLGLAVANSLAGLRAGARQVECTINGIGERAGNASLEEIVMALTVRGDDLGLKTGINTQEIYRTSKMVSTISGLKVQRNKAIVGANAFAHESGIHQDGMLKAPETYEIMRPELVGWTGESMVLGKHSGRHAFKTRLTELGYDHLTDEDVNAAFEKFKQLSDKKKEVYDEDLYAIVDEQTEKTGDEAFKLTYVGISSGSEMVPTATVKVMQGNETLVQAGTGDGPVDALFKAIQKITGVTVALNEYSLEAITGGMDAQAQVSVSVEIEGRTIKARGASTDVIEASGRAFMNAINKHFARTQKEAAGSNGVNPEVANVAQV
jgi:2-isopropylmalate synthase